jgi:hypothetical protein
MVNRRSNHMPDASDLILDAQALATGTLYNIGALHLMFQGRPVNRITAAAWKALRPSNEELQNEREADAIWRLFEEAMSIMIDRAEFASEGLWRISVDVVLVRNKVGGWSIALACEHEPES